MEQLERLTRRTQIPLTVILKVQQRRPMAGAAYDRLRFASGCKEDRSGSGDHGGTFDHYNSGYLYDSGIFPDRNCVFPYLRYIDRKKTMYNGAFWSGL